MSFFFTYLVARKQRYYFAESDVLCIEWVKYLQEVPNIFVVAAETNLLDQFGKLKLVNDSIAISINAAED